MLVLDLEILQSLRHSQAILLNALKIGSAAWILGRLGQPIKLKSIFMR